jgi:hypothetical protein
MSDPLNITNEMRALDLKKRDWYDQLTPEQQRKFSPYLMIRWGSSVQGSAELQEYYLRSLNQRLNRKFFSVNSSRHKKLLWLLATTVSPDMGSQRHTWLAAKRRESNTARLKTLRQLYPNYREDEIALMAEINTDAEINDYVQRHGEPD